MTEIFISIRERERHEKNVFCNLRRGRRLSYKADTLLERLRVGKLEIPPPPLFSFLCPFIYFPHSLPLLCCEDSLETRKVLYLFLPSFPFPSFLSLLLTLLSSLFPSLYLSLQFPSSYCEDPDLKTTPPLPFLFPPLLPVFMLSLLPHPLFLLGEKRDSSCKVGKVVKWSDKLLEREERWRRRDNTSLFVFHLVFYSFYTVLHVFSRFFSDKHTHTHMEVFFWGCSIKFAFFLSFFSYFGLVW